MRPSSESGIWATVGDVLRMSARVSNSSSPYALCCPGEVVCIHAEYGLARCLRSPGRRSSGDTAPYQPDTRSDRVQGLTTRGRAPDRPSPPDCRRPRPAPLGAWRAASPRSVSVAGLGIRSTGRPSPPGLTADALRGTTATGLSLDSPSRANTVCRARHRESDARDRDPRLRVRGRAGEGCTRDTATLRETGSPMAGRRGGRSRRNVSPLKRREARS